MSKLFKLKEWLTLDEAASYISNIIAEPVTLGDIYRLSLDEYLQVSVYFINGAKAKKGKFLKKEDITFGGEELLSILDYEDAKLYIRPINGEIQVSEDSWVSLDSKVVSITGVWDLSMVGSEALDIARYHQQETSGVELSSSYSRGTFLHQGDVVCQLQSFFYDNKYNEDSKVEQQQFEQYISSNKLTDADSQELRDEFKFKNRFRLSDDFECAITYQPSESLDAHDYCLVIKKKEVNRFIQSLEDTPQEVKPFICQERKSLLVLIAALCKKTNIDWKQGGIAGALIKMLELIGLFLGDDTIRKILVQIEPAISPDSKPHKEKPIASKERNSLLILIAALCKEANVDWEQIGIETSLVALTKLINAPLSDDIILEILSQIEPAICSRSK